MAGTNTRQTVSVNLLSGELQRLSGYSSVEIVQKARVWNVFQGPGGGLIRPLLLNSEIINYITTKLGRQLVRLKRFPFEVRNMCC